MSTIAFKKFRRRRRLKRAIICIGVSICGYLLIRIFYGESAIIGFLIWLLAYGICLLIGPPLFALVRRLISSEYERAERHSEEIGDQLIFEAFGEKPLRKLHFEDGYRLVMHAIDICKELLQSEATKTRPDLQYHLLIRLAHSYVKDGQPRKAIENLQAALSIRPNSLIANHMMARVYEKMGKGNEAIAHYELAQEDETISSTLKAYLVEQIQRIKVNGPREKGPFDDTGLMWMGVR